jgi:NitT/TauT family transport system ATP-binding protein
MPNELKMVTATSEAVPLSGTTEFHIVLEQVHKGFPPSIQQPEAKSVFLGLNLAIRRGEILGVVGPNAVGKTVLCNLISNELRPDSGTITIGGRPSCEARVGYVYQNYREAMFPWLNVMENISLGLMFAGVPKRNRVVAARSLLERANLTVDVEAFPYQLSGGQQQIVAFLRAMLIQPEVLLMDEPFQSLDLENRLVLQDLLLRTLRQSAVTVVLVSHDPSEVVLLADRLVVLSKRAPHIVGTVGIDLPNPRDVLKTPIHPRFAALVSEVRRLFQEALQA